MVRSLQFSAYCSPVQRRLHRHDIGAKTWVRRELAILMYSFYITNCVCVSCYVFIRIPQLVWLFGTPWRSGFPFGRLGFRRCRGSFCPSPSEASRRRGFGLKSASGMQGLSHNQRRVSNLRSDTLPIDRAAILFTTSKNAQRNSPHFTASQATRTSIRRLL